MCVGENSAPHVAHYLNSQLTALYENSIECVKHHSDGRKPDDKHKYSFALAEFYFGKHRSRGLANKEDMMFYASFGKPEIEFICNHDALIRLKLNNGHYNLQYHSATPFSIANTEFNQTFENLEVTFRIGFNLHAMPGKDPKISKGTHLIQLIILQFSDAKFISTSPAVAVGQDALSLYLLKYLEFLQGAGNHVFFSLPDFDDDRYKLTFDFSLVGNLSTVGELHGISADKINAYLSTLWLRAAMIAGGPGGPPVDRSTICLAEYRSTWVSRLEGNSHFYLKMGAPYVRPICAREAVLYFNIEEVEFFDTHDFSLAPRQRYNDWRIAIVVDVIHETIEEGKVVRCYLDISTAHLHRQLSTFSGFDDTDELAVSYYNQLLDFFSTEYLDIIESAQYHVIYRFDGSVAVSEPGRGEEDDPKVPTRPHWSEIITSTEMYGFDQVIAVSQSSINEHFKTLWSKASGTKGTYSKILNKWFYQEYFKATFKPVTIRLLSNNKAIVWFHIEDGYLKTLNSSWQPWNEGDEYHFDDWSLAFQVDIKMCDEEELRKVATRLTKIDELFAYKHHNSHQDRLLKHIYLDLSSAEFIHDYSSFDGLFTGQTSRPIDKVRAAVHFIKEHYFTHVTERALNVLYTIPVWKTNAVLPPFALTDVAFHVYSKTALTRQNWAYVTESIEPIIAIIGMTDFRPLPSRHLQYSTYWVARVNGGLSSGIISISRRIFMEERILKLLTRVNAETTIVPVFSGVESGTWKLELETWAQNRQRKVHTCNWTLVQESNGVMLYKWEHRDGWTYEHEGSSGITNGAYSVSCVTRNYVEIPTAYKIGTLQVRIRGEVKLEMSFKTLKEKWSAKSSAKWDSSIAWLTESGGLRVSMPGNSAPIFERTEIVGDGASAMFVDPHSLLQKSLPRTIHLDEVKKAFKAVEGIWNYCYLGLGTESYALASPVFNIHGDLLFELRPHENYQVVSTSSGARSRQVSRSKNGASRPLIPKASSIFDKVVEAATNVLYSDVVSTNGHNNGHANGHSIETQGNGVAFASKETKVVEVASVAESVEQLHIA